MSNKQNGYPLVMNNNKEYVNLLLNILYILHQV